MSCNNKKYISSLLLEKREAQHQRELSQATHARVLVVVGGRGRAGRGGGARIGGLGIRENAREGNDIF